MGRDRPAREAIQSLTGTVKTMSSTDGQILGVLTGLVAARDRINRDLETIATTMLRMTEEGIEPTAKLAAANRDRIDEVGAEFTRLWATLSNQLEELADRIADLEDSMP